jgi:hypothetical protein
MAYVMFVTMKVILHNFFDIEIWRQKEKGT